MTLFQPLVFFLCAVTSFVCMALLIRGWRRTQTRLLLWTAVCFVGLAANNLLVFFDIVVFPEVTGFVPFRHLTSLLAVSALLWGFVWESD